MKKTPDPAQPEPLAIIGIGCLFPKADSLASFWANIKHGVDAIASSADALAARGLLRRRPQAARHDLRPPRRLSRSGRFRSAAVRHRPERPRSHRHVAAPGLVAADRRFATRDTRPAGTRPTGDRSTAIGERHPRRHRHAGAGHPAGRPPRASDLAAGPARGRRG